ncbi:O-antigen/teichoic acid export membrane protein [Humitalea rosea]|uniref:O-antigen/teichoic acid export membrane protein n=1 Tax=Humitalea rosea TaxID=990373 RepID=A0A2W7I3A9_9PROT|nr:hypothetical protein [Humitalea rosea]PZW40798.1 O-antigen/teichoic acid export membrane protein [Humitalea rosea]
MWTKLHLARASWTLIDQGIVSAGTFVINVILARWLSQPDYGTFALVFSGIFTLQLFTNSLLFHPLQVRLVITRPEDQARLLSASLILLTILSLGLGAVLFVSLFWIGRSDLLLPAMICFLLGQIQEALRRGLHATFRHRAAVLGDSISVGGRTLLILGLALADALTLEDALISMAAASGIAALVQAFQLDLRRRGPFRLGTTLAEYWSLGGLWSLGNALLSSLRLQIPLWALAIGAGSAAAASFQAAMNVANLCNPIIVGLANIIPQTAAQARVKGNAHAWRATRVYVVLTILPLALYSGAVLVAPELSLRLLYGAQSEYLGLTEAVRLLVIAGLAATLTEVVIAFLHGIGEVPSALAINAIGTVATLVLAVVLIADLGLTGSCLALIGGSAARLVAAHYVLTQATAELGRYGRAEPGRGHST